MEQHWSYFYIALVMLAINDYAHALEVKVIPTAAKVAKTRNVEVTLQYNNTGPVTLFIYNWLLPQQTLDDPIFRVTRNGKPVQYTGKLIKRSRPTAADVITLAPGKTIKSLVDVSSAYNMTQSDSYTIEFNMDIELCCSQRLAHRRLKARQPSMAMTLYCSQPLLHFSSKVVKMR